MIFHILKLKMADAPVQDQQRRNRTTNDGEKYMYICFVICDIAILSIYRNGSELNTFLYLHLTFTLLYGMSNHSIPQLIFGFGLLATYIYGSRVLTGTTQFDGLFFYSFAICVYPFYYKVFKLGTLIFLAAVLLLFRTIASCCIPSGGDIDLSIYRAVRMNHNAIRRMRTGIVPSNIAEDEHPSCSICLENYVPGEESRTLNCKHMFHKTCIDGWLANHDTCPLCRVDVSAV